MSRRFVATSLLVGNFIVGTSVLAPTGMLNELASGFGISIREASLLITFGAVVMCFGSPLLSWLTSRFDRRLLLGSSLLIIALANLASAYALSFASLLGLRLLMLAAAAPFTPQAASAVGALVGSEQRASTIAFVFLGWSLATALGIPIVTNVASAYGWQASYLAIGALSLLGFVLLLWRMPHGVQTPPVELATWRTVLQSREILRLLLLTVLLTSGQFVVFTFLGPLLRLLADAGPRAIALIFALFGLAGLTGNLTATRVVGRWGTYKTSLAAVCAMLTGVVLWSLGAGTLLAMTLAIGVWGLGFASSNSMQQARLVAVAPLAAGASVALNTSAIYIGQAFGSALGGMLFAREHYLALGYAGAAFMLAGLTVLHSTRPAPARTLEA